MTNELVCPKCNMLSPYHMVIENEIHHAAYCDVCGTFIKFIPHSTKSAQFYFGRYKHIDVSTITDKQYLEFSLDLPMISDKLRDVIQKQVNRLNLIENG